MGRPSLTGSRLAFGLLAIVPACGSGPDAVPPERIVPAAELPSADTGRIDLGSLQGRFVFGAGSTLDRTEIFTVRADGSRLSRLTHNRIPDFDPTWSPDGRRIAFRRQLEGEDDEIFVIGSDGGRARNLTRDPAADWGPDWSTSTDRIAFNSGRASPSDLHGFVMDPRGNALNQLRDDVFVEYPSWSPDGQRIAFMSQTWEGPGGNYEIFVKDADGSNVTRLTEVPGSDGWPAWSPDGSRIAFTSERDDCEPSDPDCDEPPNVGVFHTLYVMNTDGSDQTRLTDVFGQFAVWSPDGAYIAFTPAPGGIWVMRPDGSDLTLLPIDGLPGEPEMPDWVA